MHGDPGVTEIYKVTGSIFLGDPAVDISHLVSRLASFHLISSYHTMNYTFCLFPSINFIRTCRDSMWIDAIAWILTAC